MNRLAWLAALLLTTLAGSARAQEEDPPIALRPVRDLSCQVIRHGCGPRLYHRKWELRAGSGRISLRPDGGASELRLSDGAVLGRPGPGKAWKRAGDGALLFPELLGAEALRGRYRRAEGLGTKGCIVLEPRRDGDRGVVTRLELRVNPGGRPVEARLRFAGGGLEVREYSGWASFESGDTGPEAVAPAGETAWPPELEWGSPLEAALRSAREKVGAIEDLSGTFEREKRTILLSRPVTARGRFTYVPGRLLWIDELPRKSEVLITRGGLDIYDPGNRRLERFKFGDEAVGKYVFLGFEDSLVEGLRPMDPVRFDVGKSELRLEMVPTGGPLADQVARITLSLDAASGLLSRFEYSDPSGDSVVTRFTTVERNSGLDPAEVAIRPAPGTRVIEMEGGLPWR